jgi:RNA ligase
MQLFDYVDRDKLMQQIADGMVKEQVHPSLPLRILNYTQKAQYTPELWNDVTDKCRGLIFDAKSNEIVARGFVKFWNYSDSRHPETMPENFPGIVPIITRKMDGSLGILYCYEGQWAVATRGSFASDQAKWATSVLGLHHPNFKWVEGFTPLVEIIYPENQIVVKYDWSDLVLLAGVRIATGEEMTREVLEELGSKNGLRVVESFDKSIEVCTSEDIENEEGYVIAWQRPGTWPLRVKVKMETYCRLHRLLTGTNPVTVWEMLKDGLDLTTVTTDAPADFVAWINGVESSLRRSYRAIEDAALVAMLEYEGEKIITTPEQRKQFALYATSKQPVTPILFAILDGKDYAPIIWRMVRPKAADTFKVDVDG